jgi:phosphate starvation-inducible protein PhoH
MAKRKNGNEVNDPILTRGDFNHIKFTKTQKKLFDTINENFLTVCTGPAGTATHNTC